MSDRYVGNISATRRLDGSVDMQVEPGPIRITQLVLDLALPELLTQAGDLLLFHGHAEDGDCQIYEYRIVGSEPGPEGGWVLCEPVEAGQQK